MTRILARSWIGLLMTALTVPGVWLIQRLAAPLGNDWLPIAVMALLGEALLMLVAARSSPPRPRQADTPLDAPLPDPLGIDPRWLWQALPPAAAALILFFAILV